MNNLKTKRNGCRTRYMAEREQEKAGRRIFWKMFSNHTWRPQKKKNISSPNEFSNIERHIWSLSRLSWLHIPFSHSFTHLNEKYESNLDFKVFFFVCLCSQIETFSKKNIFSCFFLFITSYHLWQAEWRQKDEKLFTFRLVKRHEAAVKCHLLLLREDEE